MMSNFGLAWPVKPKSASKMSGGGAGSTHRLYKVGKTVVLGRLRTVYRDASGKEYINVSQTTLEEYLDKIAADQNKSAKQPVKRKTSVKKPKTSVKKRKTSVKKRKTSVKKRKTSVKKRKTSVKKRKTSVKKRKTSVKKRKTPAAKPKSATKKHTNTRVTSATRKTVRQTPTRQGRFFRGL